MKTIVDQIARDFNVTKKLSKELIDSVIVSLASEILSEGELRINGFGSFKVKVKPARNGRNPKTGDVIQIPEHKVVKFTVAKGLKEAIQ